MKEIKIVSRYDSSKVLLCGKYESIKDCLEKNRDANLSDANLLGTNLSGANLLGTYLSRTDLSGAENYLDSHDFFIEIVRRQQIKTFTNNEWLMIGQITIHRLCWDSIKKRYDKKIMPVFKKLSKVKFDEWEKHYKELISKN